MDAVLNLVKVVVIIQITLIILAVFLLYLGKIFFFYKDMRDDTKQERIIGLMNFYFTEEENIPPTILNEFKKSIFYVLLHLMVLERTESTSLRFLRFKDELSRHVLIPIARKRAKSRDWFQKYIATLCYLYGRELDVIDNEILFNLISDDSLLVSVNAAKVATKFYTPTLINMLINIYSKARRMRQSLYANFIMTEDPDIASIIIKRLKREKNRGIRTFCYRLLSKLSIDKQSPFLMEDDLQSDSVDLKIATLDYISYVGNPLNKKMISLLSKDSYWEVRAITSKILGVANNEESLQVLDALLKDRNWQVRLNAAFALYKRGEPGIAILSKQSLQLNPLGYMAAQDVLMQGKMHQGL